MPARVKRIDEELEVVRSTEAAGRREEPDHLVAPRAGVRMFHHRQHLDVREAHLLDVGHEPVGHLAIRVQASIRRALPAAEMHFIDRHRPALPLLVAAPGRHPVLVPPLIAAAVPDDRRGVGRPFEEAAARIGLEDRQAIGADDLELVGIADAEIRDEDFPIPARAQRPHRVHASVPGVEVADHADAFRIRRPDREVHTVADAMGDAAGAQLLERLEVRALAEQVQIETGEHRDRIDTGRRSRSRTRRSTPGARGSQTPRAWPTARRSRTGLPGERA